ncbi:MAG: hypothetical protein D6725_01220 [Planctomycetota bacterium]|nr:MAG: hypothetical protein D6725_01220 [Planctomycetota bacterium]
MGRPLIGHAALGVRGRVRTLAGTGVRGHAGDGGPAVRAAVAEPYGVAIGPDGALYVCEVAAHSIRRIDLRTGRIETAAGCGDRGYSGDGGPAREARLNEPYEVRFDRAGNMYFVEMKNHVVRRVGLDGRIETVAGCGEAGFSGDGGAARKAKLNRPHSIAIVGESLFICDIGNHRVRRVDLATGRIETFAGTGRRGPTPDGAPLDGTPLNGPRALDVGRGGDLWLALREGNAVYRIDMGARRLFHVAGTGERGYRGAGGPAKHALLSGPKGIAVGPGGDVFLADTESHTIRVIRARTGVIETIVGDGVRGDGPDGDPRRCRLARPHGVCVDRRGRVFIGDSENHKVRVWEPAPVTP